MNIKIIACRVDQLPVVEEMDNGLKAMQEFVGGYIEMVALAPGLALILNEQGKLAGMPFNRFLFGGQDYVAGDCFITRVNEEGDCVSVTEEDIKKYANF